MQCPKCLANVPDGTATCPSCGASLAPASADGFFKRPGGIGADGAILTGSAVSSAPSGTTGSVHCTACGATLDGSAKFCTVCGAPVGTTSAAPTDADAAGRLSGSGVRINMGKAHAGSSSSSASGFAGGAPAPTPTPTPAPEPVYETPAPTAPVAVSFLRRLGTSPLYLTATILYSLLAALCLYFGFTAFTSIPFSYMEGGQVALVCFFILYIIVPPVCAAIGLWLLFGAAKGGSSHTLSTSGLTTLSVASMVAAAMQVILVFIIIAMISETASLFRSSYRSYYRSSDSNSQMLAVVVVFALLVTPSIIYRVKLFAMNYGAARAARYGGTPPVPSDYVSVVLVLSGVISLLLVFLLPTTADDLSVVFAYLYLVLGGVSNILLGALASVARRQWVEQMAR